MWAVVVEEFRAVVGGVRNWRRTGVVAGLEKHPGTSAVHSLTAQLLAILFPSNRIQANGQEQPST